ncbi:MAG: hypothetical protein KJ559_01525 [Nanoarchaeota archaeon]|nr:hypothetical protein [Nanoarchaeota archaeon]
MLIKNLRDVIGVDLPEDIEITERTKQTMVECAQSGRYLIDNVRIATGRIFTDKEYEERRERILSTPLP